MKKLVFALLFALSVMPAAHADSFTFSLNESYVYGLPGSTISFFATVLAPQSNANTVYLNGDAFNVTGSATLDDSDYFNNFPLSLDPGQSYTGALFTMTLPSQAGAPSSGYFSILGGADGNTFNTLGTATFTAADTPEPASWVLLGTALALGALAWRSRASAGVKLLRS